jgi:hypothetical protein
MVLVLRFPENHRTFGVIGLPVEADASLSVSIRRRTSKFSCMGGPTPTTMEQPKTVIGAIDVRSARAHVNCNAFFGLKATLQVASILKG